MINPYRISIGVKTIRYNIGDILECTETVSTKELDLTNPEFDIRPGDQYKITDRDNFPENSTFHWYELTIMIHGVVDRDIILNAWVDGGHYLAMDDKFRKIQH